MKRLAVCLITTAVVGCAPLPPKVRGLTEQQNSVNDIWSNNVASCVKTLDKLDAQSTSSSTAKLVIAIIGTLAGSVMAPVAKGSGKDAWAGLSGSTNALQTALDNSFSASLMLKEALYVAAVVVDTNKAFIAATDPNKQVQIANSLPILCRLARLKAVDEANKAVSQGNSDTDKKITALLLATASQDDNAVPARAATVAPAQATAVLAPASDH
jgi:hypothetical protein